MAQPVFEPCAPWADSEQFTLCEPGDVRPNVMADAVAVANSVLFVKTQRIFTGVCEDEWRPTGCGCRNRYVCLCSHYSEIELRFQPALAVSEVRIDGAILAASAYTLGDPNEPRFEGRLFRLDGLPWPTVQDIALPVTQEDTWQISYTWGTPPPAGGDHMVEILACEYVKAWSGGKCRLSGTVSQITRENVTQIMRDRLAAIEAGRLGIDEIDQWIAAINPSGADRTPRVLTPEQFGLDRDPTQHNRSHIWPMA